MDSLDTTTTNPTPSAKPIATRYGLIGSLIIIVIGLVIQLTGFSDPSEQYSAGNILSGVITYIIMGAAAYMTVKEHRDTNLKGLIPFGKAFGTGMLVMVIIAVLQSIWAFIYMQFINPDLMAEIMEKAMDKAMEQGQMTEEQLEASSGMIGFFTSPWFIALSSLIGTLVMGMLISLVVSLILKKEPKTASF